MRTGLKRGQLIIPLRYSPAFVVVHYQRRMKFCASLWPTLLLIYMHESEAMRALARANVRAHIYAFTAARRLHEAKGKVGEGEGRPLGVTAVILPFMQGGARLKGRFAARFAGRVSLSTTTRTRRTTFSSSVNKFHASLSLHNEIRTRKGNTIVASLGVRANEGIEHHVWSLWRFFYYANLNRREQDWSWDK